MYWVVDVWSFSPHDDTKNYFLAPFCRWRNWDSWKLRNSFKVTKLLNNSAQFTHRSVFLLWQCTRVCSERWWKDDVRKLGCKMRKLDTWLHNDWGKEKPSNIFCHIEEGSDMFCFAPKTCVSYKCWQSRFWNTIAVTCFSAFYLIKNRHWIYNSKWLKIKLELSASPWAASIMCISKFAITFFFYWKEWSGMIFQNDWGKASGLSLICQNENKNNLIFLLLSF